MIPGALLASVPFVFSALRAIATGADFRYLWLAVSSTLTAAIILGVRGGGGRPSLVRSIVAVLAAAGAAAGIAFAQGAGSVPAVLVVALGFAVCSAAGLSLVFRALAIRAR